MSSLASPLADVQASDFVAKVKEEGFTNLVPGAHRHALVAPAAVSGLERLWRGMEEREMVIMDSFCSI